uniref:Uncharacterized protein n=1 Tax=Arundo donax TaxID=35708 RepID=A0A0A9GIV1_ARUDO
MHPDFALQETHLSCPGHQQPVFVRRLYQTPPLCSHANI